jgi:hypothetical protein
MSLELLQKPAADADFLRIFNRLCVALREPADDSGITQGVYFDALKDLPITALSAAAAMLASDAGRKFFPTTGEWRAAAETAYQHQLREAVKPARSEPWRVECDACDDCGWTSHDCDGGASAWPEQGSALEVGTKTTNPAINRKNAGRTYRAEPRTTTKPRAIVCGRTEPHQPHTFSKVCGCRATNRTYQRHQRFGSGE